MIYLQEYIGSEVGQRHALASDRIILGRHPDCDLVLDSAAVSRQHAQIVRLNEDYFVEDLNSRNGTFVNGQLVQGRRLLGEGDVLRICDLTWSFHCQNRAIDRTTDLVLGDTAVRRALVIDDDDSRTTITSKLDATSSHSGVWLTAKPEAKLKALLEITNSLSKTLELDEILPRLLESLFKIFAQADRALLVLRGEDGQLLPKAIRSRRGVCDETIRISRTIIGQALSSKKAVLSADAASDERFDMSQSVMDFRIRSIMCAPIVNGDAVALGVIQVDTLDQRSRFTADDLAVLVGVASQAAVAIDNAQLHAQAVRQQQVLRDLELARQVQQSMLPTAPPNVPNYRFFDFYRAARDVGGDYFDYITLPDGRLAIVLADVSGKGMPAALLMARLSSEVRYSLASEPTPAAAVRRLNAELVAGRWQDRFVTLVLAVLDPREHVLTLVNAGHCPPLLRRDSQPVEELAEQQTGLPLGVAEDYVYEQAVINVLPGDFFLLLTDGISEAMNGRNELYGLERVRRQVAMPIGSVAELGRHVLSDLRNFVGDQPQSDDICLTCFGRDHA